MFSSFLHLSQLQAEIFCSPPQNWKRMGIQLTSPSFRQKSYWGCFTFWALKICAAVVKYAVPGQIWLKPALCGGTSTLCVGPEVNCWWIYLQNKESKEVVWCAADECFCICNVGDYYSAPPGILDQDPDEDWVRSRQNEGRAYQEWDEDADVDESGEVLRLITCII